MKQREVRPIHLRRKGNKLKGETSNGGEEPSHSSSTEVGEKRREDRKRRGSRHLPKRGKNLRRLSSGGKKLRCCQIENWKRQLLSRLMWILQGRGGQGREKKCRRSSRKEGIQRYKRNPEFHLMTCRPKGGKGRGGGTLAAERRLC